MTCPWLSFFICKIGPVITSTLLVYSGSEDKPSACHAGDLGSMPGLGRSPGEGNGNPLQYSCWRIPWRGAWQATVHRVSKSWTQLSKFTSLTGLQECKNWIKNVQRYYGPSLKFFVNSAWIHIRVNSIHTLTLTLLCSYPSPNLFLLKAFCITDLHSLTQQQQAFLKNMLEVIWKKFKILLQDIENIKITECSLSWGSTDYSNYTGI